VAPPGPQEGWLGKSLRDSGGKAAVVVKCEGKPAVIVNAHTGKNLSLPLKAVRHGFCHDDRAAALYILAKSVRIERAQPQGSVQIRLSSWAVLDAAFSDDAVTFSEVRGKLRCFDCSGAPRWEHGFGADAHAVGVAWRADVRRWVAYVSGPTWSGVSTLDEQGQSEERIDVPCYLIPRLAPSGDALVDITGKVFDPLTGREIYRLEPGLDDGSTQTTS
jgi:hypothetical protein